MPPSPRATSRALAFAAVLLSSSGLVGLATGLSACDEESSGLCGGTVVDAAVPGPDAGSVCAFPCPVTSPGLGAGGDTYANFAAPFFDGYCARCHESTRTENCFLASDPTCRNGAPTGHDWDDPADVRRHLDHIRAVLSVGPEVALTMPPDLPVTPDPARPAPSCEQRYRMIRWIDADAPGLP